jgi:hypothetical protein
MYADDNQLYSLNQTIEEASMVMEMDGRITGERYKITHLDLSKYQVMMMTKGNGNITDVDIDTITIKYVRRNR